MFFIGYSRPLSFFNAAGKSCHSIGRELRPPFSILVKRRDRRNYTKIQLKSENDEVLKTVDTYDPFFNATTLTPNTTYKIIATPYDKSNHYNIEVTEYFAKTKP